MSTTTFNKKLLPYAISLAVAGPTAGLVQAQGTLVLEEITITAQKREESLQEAPIAISAFSEQAISKYSAGSVKELIKFAPNVAETAGPLGGDSAQYFIRGIGQTDNNAATDPGVGTYLDGVYLGRTGGASLDLLDVQRIEILRGPQGTLFGRNTIGGAVSIVTADPSTDALYGKVRGIVGERHRYEGGASINVPFTDTMAGRFSILSKQQDGWGKRVYDDETMGDVDTLAGRAKFLWDITPDFSALLSIDATESRGTSDHVILTGYDPTAGVTPLAVPFPTTPITADTSNDREDNFSSIDPRYDTDVVGTSLTLTWDLNAVTIKSITAYRELEQDITNDYDGTGWVLYDNNVVMDQNQLSQEFQFSGLAMNDRLTWLAGFYYYEEEVDYRNTITMGTNNGLSPFAPGYATPRFGPAISNNQAFNLDITSYALFGQATYDLTERLSLTLGMRYNDEEKEQAFDFYIDNTDCVYSFASFPCMVIPTLSPRNPMVGVPTTYKDDWDSFDPKVALEYRTSDQAMVYISYAEGFRSGGFNGRPTPNAMGQFAPVNSYDPETVENWEVGLKSEWFDNRLRLNAAAFYGDYKDKQLLVLNANGFFDNENAAEATIQGVELEFVALLSESFEVNGGIGHTDAEYDSLDASAIAAGLTKSTELQVTPKWTANLGIQYTWFMDQNGSFSARADYSFRDEVWYGAANAPLEYQGSISITNARFVWTSADEVWSAAVYGLNVFDEEYYANGQDVRGALGVAFASVNRPTEWGLEVNYNF